MTDQSYDKWLDDMTDSVRRKNKALMAPVEPSWEPEEGCRCRYFGDTDNPCDGHYEIVLDGDCTCFRGAQCGACEHAYLECAECGHGSRDV